MSCCFLWRRVAVEFAEEVLLFPVDPPGAFDDSVDGRPDGGVDDAVDLLGLGLVGDRRACPSHGLPRFVGAVVGAELRRFRFRRSCQQVGVSFMIRTGGSAVADRGSALGASMTPTCLR